jgi:hypothetical protein
MALTITNTCWCGAPADFSIGWIEPICCIAHRLSRSGPVMSYDAMMEHEQRRHAEAQPVLVAQIPKPRSRTSPRRW